MSNLSFLSTFLSAFIAFEYFFEKNYFFENFFETFGMIKPLCNDEGQWWSWKGSQFKGASALTHKLGNFSGRRVAFVGLEKWDFFHNLGRYQMVKRYFSYFLILSWAETATVILRSPNSAFISKNHFVAISFLLCSHLL